MDHNAIIAAMEKNPRYQKAIQRLGSMDPRQRAILDLVVADKAFADPMMAREISALNRAAQMKFFERKLSAAQDHGEEAYALDKEKRDFLDKQGSLAEAVGLGDLVIGGALGHRKMKLDLAQAAQTRDMRRKLIKATESLGSNSQ